MKKGPADTGIKKLRNAKLLMDCKSFDICSEVGPIFGIYGPYCGQQDMNSPATTAVNYSDFFRFRHRNSAEIIFDYQFFLRNVYMLTFLVRISESAVD